MNRKFKNSLLAAGLLAIFSFCESSVLANSTVTGESRQEEGNKKKPDKGETPCGGGGAPSVKCGVSGKIASVEKDSFTLTLTEKSSVSETPAGTKTLTFYIDKDTTIEGKLKVGANAEVTYREEGGKNIAISVRVF